MIALAERVDREGHESLTSLHYVAAVKRRRRRYHGYGQSIENFFADTAAGYAGGARRAHRALNRAIEIASGHEFAELPTLVQ